MRAKVLTPKSLHLTNFVPDRKVSASNPALRLYLTVTSNSLAEKIQAEKC